MIASWIALIVIALIVLPLLEEFQDWCERKRNYDGYVKPLLDTSKENED